MLTKAGIELEDYAITTFSDRVWIAQQVGHLPIHIFVSTQSLERYCERLKTGTEVSKKKRKEYNPAKDWLTIELDYGSVIIDGIMNEKNITMGGRLIGWETNPNRTQAIIDEAQRMLATINQVNLGSYESMGQQLLERKRKRDAKPKPKRPAPQPDLLKGSKYQQWKDKIKSGLWRHPEDDSTDEDVD